MISSKLELERKVLSHHELRSKATQAATMWSRSKRSRANAKRHKRNAQRQAASAARLLAELRGSLKDATYRQLIAQHGIEPRVASQVIQAHNKGGAACRAENAK